MSDPSLKQRLQADLHTAMRERDGLRTSTLRMALAAITTREVAGESARELTHAETIKVLTKEAKQRKEAITAYVAAGRGELAAQETAELQVLEAYLPTQLDAAQLEDAVRAAIAETGATSPTQLGLVMKAAQTRIAGRADGAQVAAMARRLLAG